MIIFGFGFLLGGFTVMLMLGLVYFYSHRTVISKRQKTGVDPLQDVSYSEICPRLAVLNGGKDQTSFKKAFS